jgi:tetratricopeptide (TPR) repeat protein
MTEAREHLASAERIGQGVGPAFALVRRLFRAHAEVAVGDPTRALALLREAEDEGMFAGLSPADRWHFLRAVVFAMGGFADEAHDVLRAFEAEVPLEFHDQFRIRNESARALVLLQGGDAKASVEVLEGIRISRRCRACFAERMGWALRDADRLTEAVEEWEDALAWQDFNHAIEWQFTQNLWVLQRLPSLYEAIGDTTKALAYYHRFVDLWANADPELQPRVQEARERITALAGHDEDSNPGGSEPRHSPSPRIPPAPREDPPAVGEGRWGHPWPS